MCVCGGVGVCVCVGGGGGLCRGRMDEVEKLI